MVASLFEVIPFPFHDPAADELLRTLKALYYEPRAIRHLLLSLGEAGVDPSLIDFEQPVHFIWRDVVERAAVQGSLRRLAEQGRDDYPTSPGARILGKLLAGGAGASTAPTRRDGSAAFRVGDETTATQERLLFGDDLTVDISALRMVLGVASAVCRIQVTTSAGTGLGTGFRIGPTLVLTNEHVLRGAQRVLVEFNYELLPSGKPAEGEPLAAKVSSIRANDDDDWAIIELESEPRGDWRVLPLPEMVRAAVGDAAFVVQHPGGLHKRVGLVRNRIELVHERVIHYLTDTQPGSSGSPVFDSTGQLLALHHAGGSLPLPADAGAHVWKNEGINIARVREGLVASGVSFGSAGARLS